MSCKMMKNKAGKIMTERYLLEPISWGLYGAFDLIEADYVRNKDGDFWLAPKRIVKKRVNLWNRNFDKLNKRK